MRKLAYNLAFNGAPVYRRIFWSAFIGMAAAIFLGDYAIERAYDYGVSFSIYGGALLKSTTFLVRLSIFTSTALFIHLLMLTCEAPRLQFSLNRLLLASIVASLYLSANLIPTTNQYAVHSSVNNPTTFSKEYGWPITFFETRQYLDGQVSDFWFPTLCVFSAALLILLILNILLFKLPEPAKSPPTQDIFPKRF